MVWCSVKYQDNFIFLPFEENIFGMVFVPTKATWLQPREKSFRYPMDSRSAGTRTVLDVLVKTELPTLSGIEL
jgi:hypothetical protein